MSGSTGRASGDVDELIDTVERWLSGGGPLLQPHEKETLRQISQRLGAVRTPQKRDAGDAPRVVTRIADAFWREWDTQDRPAEITFAVRDFLVAFGIWLDRREARAKLNALLDEYTLRVLCGEAAALLERIGHAHSSAGNSIYLRLRLATLGHDSRATADPRDAGQERKNG